MLALDLPGIASSALDGRPLRAPTCLLYTSNFGNDVTAMLANVKLLLHDNSPFLSLIVFCVNFKIALGMVAGGANLRGLLAHDDVTAVAALPHLDLCLLYTSRCV